MKRSSLCLLLFAPAAALAQTENDWQLRRLLKSFAERDYFVGYDYVRSANLVSVFWEYATYGKPPLMRGRPAPNQPILRVWVWNNTDQPLRLEPSAFRFVDGGVEVARNNSARSSIYPISSTVVAPRTVYVGDMVMSVRTGRRYTDDYALMYTSPRPKDTIVLNRWLYWKNAMSADEYARTSEKQTTFKSMWRSEEKRLNIGGLDELIALGGADKYSGQKHDPNVALRQSAQKIFEGRARSMAGMWEMQVTMAGPLLIPPYLRGSTKAQEDEKDENGQIIREKAAGTEEEARKGYFEGTMHRRGDHSPIIKTSSNSSLEPLCRIESIHVVDDAWTAVHTWDDVKHYIESHPDGSFEVMGTKSTKERFVCDVTVNWDAVRGSEKGRDFQSQTRFEAKNRKVAAPRMAPTELDAGTAEEAKDGYFAGTTHRRGSFPTVVFAATPESRLGHLYRIDGVRTRPQTDYTAVSTWADVERFLKDHPDDEEVIVAGTDAKGNDFSSLVTVNRRALGG